MSTRQLLIDTATRIFADHCDKSLLDAAERGESAEKLLAILRENGLHEAAMPERGLQLGDAFAVIKVAGGFACPLPLAEMILGCRWLEDSSPLVSIGRLDENRVSDVPWGRIADKVLGIDARGRVVLAVDGTLIESTNLAGEARDRLDDVNCEQLPAEVLIREDSAFELLTLARAVQMAGALERVLDLSLTYATEREQFGRPLSKFQAIQHNLAIMAAEVAAASRSADAGVAAIESPRFELEVSAAKSRVGEAAGVVAEMAHQIHGAMGYTHEHQLHHYTRRLWAWRDEYADESTCQAFLGQAIAAQGPENLWKFIATRT